MKQSTYRSILSVIAGLVFIFVLSILTDLILERGNFRQVLFSSSPLWLLCLAILNRCFYVVAGAYFTAMMAPFEPFKHVIVLASIGFFLGSIGVVATWDSEPHWFCIASVVLAVPSAFFGGKLKTSKNTWFSFLASGLK